MEIFDSVLEAIGNFCRANFSYRSFVILDDLLMALSAFLLGMFVMGFITSFVAYKTTKHNNKKLDNFNYIKYKEENKNKYLVNPKNVFEVYYVIMLIIITEFISQKNFSVKTEKRAKRIIITITIIAIIILILTLISVNSVIYPDSLH